MGIRFHCPNGHKLNVKSFLAGKRGICPHCGVKVDIPDDAAQSSPGDSSPETTTAAVEGATSETRQPTSGMAVPVAAPEASPQKSSRSVPMGAVPTSSAGETAVVARSVAPPARKDPLTEVPGAKWYVRPVSGGQFGPADVEAFRGWVEQGRVTADSLIWRDGWAEWQPASAVLSQLNSDAPPPPPGGATVAPAAVGVSAPAEEDSSPRVGTPGIVRHRRRSNSAALALFIVLAISSIVLIGLLVMVVLSTFSS